MSAGSVHSVVLAMKWWEFAGNWTGQKNVWMDYTNQVVGGGVLWGGNGVECWTHRMNYILDTMRISEKIEDTMRISEKIEEKQTQNK